MNAYVAVVESAAEAELKADVLAAADRARRAEVECERLRELLAIAREGLLAADASLAHHADAAVRVAVFDAIRRSDPDATPEDGAS